jgi:hypothetical protein
MVSPKQNEHPGPGLSCKCCSCCSSAKISSKLLEEIKNATSVRIQMLISYNEVYGDFGVLGGTDDIDVTFPWDGVGNWLIDEDCRTPAEPPFATTQTDRFWIDIFGNNVGYDQYAFYLGVQSGCLQFYYADLASRYSHGLIGGLAGSATLWPYQINAPDALATNFITVNGQKLNALVPNKMTKLIDYQTCENQNFENCIEYLHAVNSASITLTFIE